MSRTRVLLPIKNFARAKSRLSAVLERRERIHLAQRMADHVLRTLLHSDVAAVEVLTDDNDVALAARTLGATVRRDPPGMKDFGDIVRTAVDAQPREAPLLILMADLPRLTVADVHALVHAASDAVVLAPDLAGKGTNGLWLPYRNAIPTHFGHSDSADRHRAAAAAAKIPLIEVRRMGLAFDLDGPDDL